MASDQADISATQLKFGRHKPCQSPSLTSNSVVNAVCARILALLEDDEQSKIVIESLEQSGHIVDRSANFKDAIAYLEKRGVVLILSDVHLENGGNVFDFLIWAKRNPLTSSTPFVLLSYQPTVLAKHLEDGLRTTARLLGARSYITTDRFKIGEFRKQIDSLLPAAEKDDTRIEKPDPTHTDTKG